PTSRNAKARAEMAATKKKITGYIKLQLPAGKANPAPPVGPALGQHGVNIMAFCKDFNARSQKLGDTIVPVVITVCPVGAECVDGWRTKDSTPTLFSENCGE